MFTPSRLALARRRRGLTKKRLAKLVGVSVRSITGFEIGEIQPSPLTTTQIAETLRFPVSFFEADDLEEIPDSAASFRALKKMTASQRHAATAAGTLARALHDWIADRFKLPEPNVPKLGPGLDPETAAEVVRAEWELGEAPISNMLHLLERHGVRVFSLAEESREVDAFSLWHHEMPFVYLNTQKSGEHSRFDAAHELGHLVMHWHHQVPQGKDAEREAQQFASAFLLPRSRMLATAVQSPNVQELIQLKRPWKVSVSALAYRLRDLQVLTEWHYRSICVELSKRGFRTKEPSPIRRETSQILSKVFLALRREGVGKADIARALHVFPEDLDALVFGLTMLPLEGNGEDHPQKSSASPALTLLQGGGATD